jgi:hypothetical protein
VGLFRRREPLHEQLAREGGLDLEPVAEARPPWGAEGAPVSGPGVAASGGDASSPRRMETGIHGVPRAREWDLVITVDAPGVDGDRVRFVALPDDTLLVEEGEEVEPLAAAVDRVAATPYRAEAARRGESQWAVGIRGIDVVELREDPGGTELTLTVHDGEQTLIVDGAHAVASVPELEELGAARSRSYVVQAKRLDGSIWEVEAMPL